MKYSLHFKINRRKIRNDKMEYLLQYDAQYYIFD